MKIDWSFPRQVGITIAALWGAALYPLIRYGSPEMITAAIAGTALAAANVLAGYAAIEYAFGKSMSTFLKYVLGGMGIRMLVMAAVLVLLIKLLGLHVAALVASLGVFYAVFLALEVLFIQRKISIKQE
jgi:hypothetical protein